MSIHDMDIANQAGAATRADLNLALVALVGNSNSPTAPTPSFAYQYWADTSTGMFKQRNAANTLWINLFIIATGAWITATNQSGGTVNATTVAASSSILSSSPTGGIGYATGAGGSVTQATSLTTAVTINKVCGKITTFNDTYVGGAGYTFDVVNSSYAVGDVVVLTSNNPETTLQIKAIHFETNGTFRINIFASGASSLTGNRIIYFAIIKAVIT